ncbi:MAG: tetratricopeptide repeat protein [Bacteroidota bacterium]
MSILFFSLFLGISQTAYAQNAKLDSLEKLLATELAPADRQNVLLKLSHYIQYSAPQKTVSYSEEALAIAKERNDSLGMADAYSRLGTGYQMLGSLENSRKYIFLSLELYQQLEKKKEVGISQTNAGLFYEKRGLLDSAIYYFDLALESYEEEGTALDSAIVYNNLGIAYERLGEYPNAVKTYFMAYEGFEKAGSEHYSSFPLLNMGNIYLLQGDLARAYERYEQALGIKQKFEDKLGEAMVYEGFAEIFEKKNELDSAIYFIQQGIKLWEELKHEEGKSAAYLKLGNYYVKQEKYSEALFLIERSYEICKRIEIREKWAAASVQLAKLYFILDKTKKAEVFALETLEVIDKNAEPEHRLSAYQVLADVYQSRKDPEGFVYFEKAYELRDSLRNDDNVRRIAKMEAGYEADKERELLEIEQQKKELAMQSEIDRNIFQRNLGIGVAVSILIILFVLYHSYQQKQRSNQLLEVQRNELELSLKDRENLLKEIHHRVKNNLQVISSLLSLQSRSVNDPAALDALEEGRNRVKAMGLIHQNLYQEENLVGVNLADYIEKLTASLLQSYQLSSSKIRITQNIDPVSLDVDTLIPLGLILNELISNALKYAFKGREKGIIDLSIQEQAAGLAIDIKDDGVGLDENFDVSKTDSMGFKLIRAFVQKMKASLVIRSENGTHIHILLPKEGVKA